MDTELLERIDRRIAASDADLVADITRLVAIRSTEGEPLPGAPFGAGPRAVLEEVGRLGQAAGYALTDYGCGVISLARGEGQPDLGIWLHGDVVPEGQGWQFDPYRAVEHAGCVIGRGAADNKGQLAAILCLFRILDALGVDLPYTPAIYVGSNEETGMRDLLGRPGDPDAPGFLQVAEPPRISLVPDGGFPLGYGGKGSCTLTLASQRALTSCTLLAGQSDAPGSAYATFPRTDLPGVLAGCKLTVQDGGTVVETYTPPRHGASPDPDGNMITRLSEALLAASLVTQEEREILEFFREVSTDIHGECLGIRTHHEVLGDLTVFARSVDCKDGRAAITLGIRYPLGITYDEIVARASAAASSRGFSLLEATLGVAPYMTERDSEVARLLCEATAAVTGEKAPPFTLSGATYAHCLPNAYVFGMSSNRPPVDFPKGRGGAHGVDEAVSLERLKCAMRIYARALLMLGRLLG